MIRDTILSLADTLHISRAYTHIHTYTHTHLYVGKTTNFGPSWVCLGLAAALPARNLHLCIALVALLPHCRRATFVSCVGICVLCSCNCVLCLCRVVYSLILPHLAAPPIVIPLATPLARNIKMVDASRSISTSHVSAFHALSHLPPMCLLSMPSRMSLPLSPILHPYLYPP